MEISFLKMKLIHSRDQNRITLSAVWNSSHNFIKVFHQHPHLRYNFEMLWNFLIEISSLCNEIMILETLHQATQMLINKMWCDLWSNITLPILKPNKSQVMRQHTALCPRKYFDYETNRYIFPFTKSQTDCADR